MSDLPTRIAAAIWDELDRQREPGFGPFVDRENNAIDTTGSDGVDMAALADAVIRELALKQENDHYDGFFGRKGRHRYVTDWKADDE